MVDDAMLRQWFCREVLPLEPALTAFIRRNWRVAEDVVDLRQDIYERALNGARAALPGNTRGYLFTVARNHLINCARRARIVSFDLVADLDESRQDVEMLHPERQLVARDELKRAMAGLENLPPRCREVVRLRRVEGLSTRETAQRLNIGTDTVERQMTLGIRALADFMLGGSGRIRRSAQTTPDTRRGRR